MTAAEFAAATPREVQWRIAAVIAESDREWDRVASLACWLLASLGAEVTPDKLLGREAQTFTF